MLLLVVVVVVVVLLLLLLAAVVTLLFALLLLCLLSRHLLSLALTNFLARFWLDLYTSVGLFLMYLPMPVWSERSQDQYFSTILNTFLALEQYLVTKAGLLPSFLLSSPSTFLLGLGFMASSLIENLTFFIVLLMRPLG